ncbi:MAG: hypothetical protein HY318_13385, partial [Armatimonadetes bacterium]|nr:hypothetical protein [Armatimonadota bacterium]
MMNSRTFGTFVLRMGTLLLMGASTGSGADQPSSGGFLAVPPMTAPVIDGRLSSATEWQSACQITGWVDSILGVANHDG